MKLKEIAAKYVDQRNVDKYLHFELPNEDPDREFELVVETEEIAIYRDMDVYLMNCSVGFVVGQWDELTEDYPAVSHLVE